MNDPLLHKYDPAYGRPAELGELARNAGRALNQRMLDQLDGSMNLLTKAVARLDAGDTGQADRLVARAAAMPYDPREEGSPGVQGAAQIVYNLISDQFEASAEDDSRWLTAAVDVHASTIGPARLNLESALHGFLLQDSLFALSRGEQRLIRKTFGHAPMEADLGDGPEATAGERVIVIDSLLGSARALRSAYGLGGQRTG